MIPQYISFLDKKGISLESIGLKEKALSKKDALDLIVIAANNNYPILGISVIKVENGKYNYTTDHWYIEKLPKIQHEERPILVSRNKAQAENYIENYKNTASGETLFVISI